MDDRYIKGIELFNQEKFHEAHDILEEMWTEQKSDPYRQMYQGVIQAAVSLYLYQEKRYPGAIKVYQRSIKSLDSFSGVVLGLDIEQLTSDLDNFFKDFDEKKEAPKSFFKLKFTNR